MQIIERASTEQSRATNGMIYSPSVKRIIAQKDASVMLRDEIGESGLRLKAAKFGHTINEIAPQYNNTFYLPH